MILKITILLAISIYSECVYVYSSFWAPLFNPRILHYRVDASFDSDSAKSARIGYEKTYGYRGEGLIANLGNGKVLRDDLPNTKVYGDVTLYST